ncbi:MAG: ABC transporter substrate-binding protein, partial [Candidatus Cloacimonetes bacterium]|nr:ABC transporter substrate-binding protein [Candidatus Cloacimonadota bacterium]
MRKIIIVSVFLIIFSVNLFANKVLAILPFESVFKEIAEEQKDAILLAVEDYDNRLEVVFKDSKGSEEGAILALDDYIREYGKPEAVISCASWIATALNPVTAEQGLFHLAIGSASIDRKYPNHTIRMTVDEKTEEELLSYYLLQYNKIAVFYMNNELGENWLNALNKKLGSKIKLSLSYNPEKRDFNNSVKQIKAIDPDVVVLISSSNAAEISKLIKQAGINVQLVGTRPIERPEMLEMAEFTEGLIYTFPSFDTGNQMLEKFESKYQYMPTFFGMEAYDATVSLILGLEENSPNDLFNWYKGKTFIGALGSVTVDRNGDANYPYMFKEIKNGKFVMADFQYALILEQTKQEIMAVFNKMDSDLKIAAKELSTGITGEKADIIIKKLHNFNKFSFDVVTLDTTGTIRNVFPKDYSDILGENVSEREYVKRIIETQKPVISKAFETLEGFVSFDFQYPIFDSNDKYIGSVSILTKPDFFADMIEDKIASFPVELCIMQTDGIIVYDINKEEIGLNLFTSDIYNDFLSLRQLGRKMSIYPQG